MMLNGQKPVRGVQINRIHPLSKGLMGAWLFNELHGEMIFEHSSRLDAVNVSGATTWEGDGVDLDGSDDVLAEAGGDNALNLYDEVTLVCKLNVTAQQAGTWGYPITRNYTAYNDVQYGLIVSNGSPPTIAPHSVSSYQVGSQHTLAFGTDYLCIATFDFGATNGKRLWVDGDFKIEEDCPSPGSKTTNYRLNFGARYAYSGGPAWGFFFTGRVYLAYIYNRVLTEPEIKYLSSNPYCVFLFPAPRIFSTPAPAVTPGAKICSATTGEVALVANTAKTILQVVAGTNHSLKILEWGVWFDGNTLTNAPVVVQFLRQTTAGTMSALTPQLRAPPTGTIDATAQYNATSEPTDGAVLSRKNVHPQGGIHQVFEQDERIIVKAGERIAVKCNAPDAVNAIAEVVFEE